MTTDADQPKLGLADAYAVETPDDNRALYRDWAETYESGFTETRGYIYHRQIAAAYERHTDGDRVGVVLDVGCGTGIVGVELAALGLGTVDGVDISPEMLDQALQKNVYRSLQVADLTLPLEIESDVYAGVVSAGTFTHGHLGPEPIRELVRITQPGGWLTLGVNAEHFDSHGFEDALSSLEDAGLIDGRSIEQVRMYEAGDDEWADDLASVVSFRASSSGPGVSNS